MKKHLIIVGGGFAGFWGAMSAFRQAQTLGKKEELQITVINPDKFLTIRPRLYEPLLDRTQVALDPYLQPLGIDQLQGKVVFLDPQANTLVANTAQGTRTMAYDYLILAAGSTLRGRNLPGIEHSFNIDQYYQAKRLQDHLTQLAQDGFTSEGARTVVIVGAGFTGLEAVTAMEQKIEKISKTVAQENTKVNIILLERSETLAENYSPEARQYIHEVLAEKGIDLRLGQTIARMDATSVTLENGQQIPTRTVIWTGGVVASPLTHFFSGERDAYNRLTVDPFLKLPEYDNVIVAGDVAKAKLDDQGNTSFMSCQHSMFQGRWAGYNAVNDLFSQPLKPYQQEKYITCLDLGAETALVTTGRDRQMWMTGAEAKSLKRRINEEIIYPMTTLEATLASAIPEIPSL